MSDTTADVSAAAPDEREALYVDIANRAQEITGRGIWPSTVKAVLEVAASVSAATPVVIDPHSSHHQPVPGCAYCPQPVYATGANAAAALDEREAFERLPERFRFSREVYGDVADDATRVLLALTDGGHADQPSDYLRWVSITAAQALTARPAPVVSGEVEYAVEWGVRSQHGQIIPQPSREHADSTLALFHRTGDAANLVRRTVTPWTVADAPTADDERCGWCGITPTHDPGDCAVAKAHESQRLADIEQAVADEGRVLEVSPGAFMEVERRPCANCGHSQPMHVCTFTSVRCRCGCVRYVPAPVADEGGER